MQGLSSRDLVNGFFFAVYDDSLAWVDFTANFDFSLEEIRRVGSRHSEGVFEMRYHDDDTKLGGEHLKETVYFTGFGRLATP